jgi:chitin synthase
MDKREGKEKCYLEERINIIIDEMENFQRRRMDDFVKNNNDFPPSIEKNLSFVYQNLWSPKSTDQYKLKILSCFKHTNGTKLSSHLWFFEGFCRQFNPEICVLLDVGTKPGPKGILRYLESFQNENIGGVTGFMSVDANFES